METYTLARRPSSSGPHCAPGLCPFTTLCPVSRTLTVLRAWTKQRPRGSLPGGLGRVALDVTACRPTSGPVASGAGHGPRGGAGGSGVVGLAMHDLADPDHALPAAAWLLVEAESTIWGDWLNLRTAPSARPCSRRSSTSSRATRRRSSSVGHRGGWSRASPIYCAGSAPSLPLFRATYFSTSSVTISRIVRSSCTA